MVETVIGYWVIVMPVANDGSSHGAMEQWLYLRVDI